MSHNKIEIYDTTLRDGAQAEGIAFTVTDKLKIIKYLDDLGVDYIEAGWPGSNPKDKEVFEAVQDMELKHSLITAFGSTRKANTLVSDDFVLNQLLSSNTKIITIFGKTWDFHVEHALCTTLEENLKMIKESVEYLKNNGRRVFFDAEHFFDGYKNNADYALKALKASLDAGAERIILCDTNGGCLSSEVYEISSIVQKEFPEAKLGIHAHNDGDMAVANSLAAVQAGIVQVQGTINGYGERCGNANLCSIIPNLQLKMNKKTIGENIENLVYVSRQVNEIANRIINDHAAFVGRSAFAHKAGIHASGVSKNSSTYEHIEPHLVGNIRRILVSDQAGAASVREKIKNLKLGTIIQKEDVPRVIQHIKDLEWQGYAFEDADASFELMIMDVLGKSPNYFELMGFRVIGDTMSGLLSELNSEASVKLKLGGEIVHTVSEGDGPVHALDCALRKALRTVYPKIRDFKLTDFKVRLFDAKDGTDSKTRVHVESSDGYHRWDTVGVSRNIIEASYLAIIDSIVYGLLLNDVTSLNPKTDCRASSEVFNK